MKSINIVIPLFNEAQSLNKFVAYVVENLNLTDYKFVISLIDDGSSDNTWEEIEKLKTQR